MLCSVRARKRFIAASGLAERCSSSISGFSFTSEGNVEDLSEQHPNPGLGSGGKKDAVDKSGWMIVVHSESGSPLQEGWGAWTSAGRRQGRPRTHWQSETLENFDEEKDDWKPVATKWKEMDGWHQTNEWISYELEL